MVNASSAQNAGSLVGRNRSIATRHSSAHRRAPAGSSCRALMRMAMSFSMLVEQVQHPPHGRLGVGSMRRPYPCQNVSRVTPQYSAVSACTRATRAPHSRSEASGPMPPSRPRTSRSGEPGVRSRTIQSRSTHLQEKSWWMIRGTGTWISARRRAWIAGSRRIMRNSWRSWRRPFGGATRSKRRAVAVGGEGVGEPSRGQRRKRPAAQAHRGVHRGLGVSGVQRHRRPPRSTRPPGPVSGSEGRRAPLAHDGRALPAARPRRAPPSVPAPRGPRAGSARAAPARAGGSGRPCSRSGRTAA